MLDHSFFVGSIFEQMGHLNSGGIVGILVLFFAACVVVVGAGVEASLEAWCRVSHPFVR